MQARIIKITEKILEKLQNNSLKSKFKLPAAEIKNAYEELNQQLDNFQDKPTNSFAGQQFYHTLLTTICQFNLLSELHEVLEILRPNDINAPIEFPIKLLELQGKTLLGWATFYGHLELVKYLVEVRLANVNQKDGSPSNGFTPLHEAVRGYCGGSDLLKPTGKDHLKIAKYLVNNGADPAIEDNNGWSSASNGVAIDFLKPNAILSVLVAAQDHPPLIIPNRQAKDFKTFCLEHAIEDYVTDGKMNYGFYSIADLYNALEAVPKEKWQNIHNAIQAQEPPPHCGRHEALKKDDFNTIAKISGLAGTLAGGLAHYFLDFRKEGSIATGIVTSLGLGFLLANQVINYRMKEQNLQQYRVDNLSKHNQFFKSAAAMPIDIADAEIKPTLTK